MIRTIQNMKHHFRTSYGDSKLYLDKSILIPYQGILQGNGAAPTTWVLISTPLLNMLRAAGKGGKFMSPISKLSTHIVGFAFVDDTDLICLNNGNPQISALEVMMEIQEAIDLWEGGLKATGGAIVPSKSWVYPIDFSFDVSGNWSYKSVEDIDVNFTVKDQDNNTTQLPTLNPNVGKETLGVYLAPDGNNSEAVSQMLA